MSNLTAKEAQSLIERIGPKLGHDHTSRPIFPKGRDDICVVKHTAENGSSYGFDVLYLVWKEPDGSLQSRELKDTRVTKDYLHVNSVEIDADEGNLKVDFGSGGSYSGVSWNETMSSSITANGQDTVDEPTSFLQEVNQAMVKVVEKHQHDHPLYQPTAVAESVIDEDLEIGTFVLFEQIDTDRQTEQDEGWLGDQFRYSLWVMKKGQEPVRLYEDHAYMRPRTKSSLTGTQGRNCALKNLKLEGDTITVSHPKGDKVEEQKWKTLSFSL